MEAGNGEQRETDPGLLRRVRPRRRRVHRGPASARTSIGVTPAGRKSPTAAPTKGRDGRGRLLHQDRRGGRRADLGAQARAAGRATRSWRPATWTGKAKPTGRTFAADWAMVFGVRNGEIASFRVVEDTAKVAAAFPLEDRAGVPQLLAQGRRIELGRRLVRRGEQRRRGADGLGASISHRRRHRQRMAPLRCRSRGRQAARPAHCRGPAARRCRGGQGIDVVGAQLLEGDVGVAGRGARRSDRRRAPWCRRTPARCAGRRPSAWRGRRCGASRGCRAAGRTTPAAPWRSPARWPTMKRAAASAWRRPFALAVRQGEGIAGVDPTKRGVTLNQPIVAARHAAAMQCCARQARPRRRRARAS